MCKLVNFVVPRETVPIAHFVLRILQIALYLVIFAVPASLLGSRARVYGGAILWAPIQSTKSDIDVDGLIPCPGLGALICEQVFRCATDSYRRPAVYLRTF